MVQDTEIVCILAAGLALTFMYMNKNSLSVSRKHISSRSASVCSAFRATGNGQHEQPDKEEGDGQGAPSPVPPVPPVPLGPPPPVPSGKPPLGPPPLGKPPPVEKRVNFPEAESGKNAKDTEADQTKCNMNHVVDADGGGDLWAPCDREAFDKHFQGCQQPSANREEINRKKRSLGCTLELGVCTSKTLGHIIPCAGRPLSTDTQGPTVTAHKNMLCSPLTAMQCENIIKNESPRDAEEEDNSWMENMFPPCSTLS